MSRMANRFSFGNDAATGNRSKDMNRLANAPQGSELNLNRWARRARPQSVHFRTYSRPWDTVVRRYSKSNLCRSSPFPRRLRKSARAVSWLWSTTRTARTILSAIDPATRPADLARPGHVFPLRAREGGVLVRAGQTEASVDLARLAGLVPAGVICEIMNPDGTMARVPQLEEFCRHHGLKMISVAQLIRYRLKHERYIHRRAEGCIETEFAEFRTVAYASEINPEMHLALIRGEPSGHENVLVRMHSHCVYGDVFGSKFCDCQRLVRESLRRIAE